MPFVSKRQQRYMYANKKKLKKKGVDVDEWAKKTDFSKLPEKKAFVAGFLKTASMGLATVVKLKHGGTPDDQFDAKQLDRGTDVETEHTSDRHVARQISKAHLAEIPDYYTRLTKMEAEAKRE